jgi:hypothetical protein
MTPETWSVLLAAAAFLLLGIAISPLAWVALLHRRSRFERELELRWRENKLRLSALESRLEDIEGASVARAVGATHAAGNAAPHGPHRTRARDSGPKPDAAPKTDLAPAPTLITVPSLAPPPSEREASITGVTNRYAAIWSLADSGASPDVIARATGQPIGQIELILGLRRQIDASRTKVPHGPHT